MQTPPAPPFSKTENRGGVKTTVLGRSSYHEVDRANFRSVIDMGMNKEVWWIYRIWI